MARVCSGVSPSCMAGLASPSSVGCTTNPSVNGLPGSGTITVRASMGSRRAKGVSR